LYPAIYGRSPSISRAMHQISTLDHSISRTRSGMCTRLSAEPRSHRRGRLSDRRRFSRPALDLARMESVAQNPSISCARTCMSPSESSEVMRIAQLLTQFFAPERNGPKWRLPMNEIKRLNDSGHSPPLRDMISARDGRARPPCRRLDGRQLDNAEDLRDITSDSHQATARWTRGQTSELSFVPGRLASAMPSGSSCDAARARPCVAPQFENRRSNGARSASRGRIARPGIDRFRAEPARRRTRSTRRGRRGHAISIAPAEAASVRARPSCASAYHSFPRGCGEVECGPAKIGEPIVYRIAKPRRTWLRALIGIIRAARRGH